MIHIRVSFVTQCSSALSSTHHRLRRESQCSLEQSYPRELRTPMKFDTSCLSIPHITRRVFQITYADVTKGGMDLLRVVSTFSRIVQSDRDVVLQIAALVHPQNHSNTRLLADCRRPISLLRSEMSLPTHEIVQTHGFPLASSRVRVSARPRSCTRWFFRTPHPGKISKARATE